jgi:hypothetical protein
VRFGKLGHGQPTNFHSTERLTFNGQRRGNVVRCVVPPWRSWWDLLHDDNVEIEREWSFHGKTPHGFFAKMPLLR